MSGFEYSVASSAENALELFGAAPDASYIAGGMTLLASIKLGLAAPEELIDLSGAGLVGIKVTGNSVKIGSMTRHADVAASTEVASAISALADLAGGIGDPQVRNRGTLGGSIANNDPAADYPAACLGLGAVIHTNTRSILADDFFTGLFETALDDGEIILSVEFPIPERAAYAKFPNPASRYALAGVFISTGPAGTRVAVTGAGLGGVYRESAFEGVLEGAFNSDAIEGMSADVNAMASDIHAAADYRAHLVGHMARAALASCA